MLVRIKRQRLIEETVLVDITDDQLREADIDADEVSDADIDDVADQLGLYDSLNYAEWETEGWEDVGQPEIEIVSYNVGR